MTLSRRQFLGASAAAVIAAGTMARGKVFGANERIGVCCMGVHGRGGDHISGFCENPDSEVVALCDVDKDVLEKRAAEIEERTKKRPKVYVDIREALADESINVVSIATPNHWHTLGAVWACQAGKDVYVEKPLSHEVWEGRQLVAAAQKHKCIVQHGTQRRSEANWMRDIKKLHEGIIGDIYMARALCYKRRDAIGKESRPAPPPANLNYDLWLGPAPFREYQQKLNEKGEPDGGLFIHYDWHWFWDFGNGDIGNQGVHQMDVAVWGLGKGLPVKVYSTGGRYTYEDLGETPNTQVATFTYGDGTMLVFEVRGRYTNTEEGVGVGNLFYGSEGYYVEGKGFFDKEGKPIPVPDSELPPTDGSYGNFLKAVRSRNEADIHGTALEGHLSSAHCHLANISYRIKRSFEFDPTAETSPDADAAALMKRQYRDPFVVPQLA